MQQYADIYSLQNYSTCFGCHSTHHQEYQKLYPQPPVQVILLVQLLPSYVVWSGLVYICWIFLFTLNYDAQNHELKTLQHVSILSDHHQGALFFAKVILQYSQFNSYLQTRCCGSISCCVVEQWLGVHRTTHN